MIPLLFSKKVNTNNCIKDVFSAKSDRDTNPQWCLCVCVGWGVYVSVHARAHVYAPACDVSVMFPGVAALTLGAGDLNPLSL